MAKHTQLQTEGAEQKWRAALVSIIPRLTSALLAKMPIYEMVGGD
jgi:hypothetical protein